MGLWWFWYKHHCMPVRNGTLTKEILLKWGHFDGAKPTLKILLASWAFYTVLTRFWTFNAESLGSVDQRAAKLPVIKLWEWLDRDRIRTWAAWFEWGRGRAADFFLRPPTLKAGNFEALLCTDPIFTALKVLNLFKKYTKYQETSYNFSLGFVLSNRPHFNSAYLLWVPFLSGIAVCRFMIFQVMGEQMNNWIWLQCILCGWENTTELQDNLYFTILYG